MAELLFKDEVFKIVGAAFEVYNELGCGLLESVYQEALALEMAAREIPFVQFAPLRINYKGQILQKQFIADFVCNGAILLELKALDQIHTVHEAQLLNYLKITKLRVGLILNFGGPTELEWKRFVI